eukprot:Sspe_Gene.43065::Locus_20946_Transcript_2_4_Confidence_0.214_Length_2386::g.43065::m.43065
MVAHSVAHPTVEGRGGSDMVSVPVSSRTGVWAALGLPDLTTTAYPQVALARVPSESRERRKSRVSFDAVHHDLPSTRPGIISPEKSHEPKDFTALGNAWMGVAGLSQAVRSAVSDQWKKDKEPSTPTGRQAPPLSASPRRYARAVLADEQRLEEREASRRVSKTVPTPAASPSNASLASIAQHGGSPEAHRAPPRLKTVATVVDLIKRVLYQLRIVHAGGNPRETEYISDSSTPEEAAERAPLPPRPPVLKDEAWDDALIAMRDPIKDIVTSVEAAMEPLYLLPSVQGDPLLLRADDAVYPLSFLHQALCALRDKVLDACSGEPNYFGSVVLQKYINDTGMLHSMVVCALQHLSLFATQRSLSAQGAVDFGVADRRDTALALLGEVVPCPSSRRFWISNFSVVALEVHRQTFGKALQPYVSDALSGVSSAVTNGLVEAMSMRRDHVSLCEYACLFGEDGVFDILDVFVTVPLHDLTYDTVFGGVLSQWKPPISRSHPGRKKVTIEDVDDSVSYAVKDLASRTLPERHGVCERCTETEASKLDLQAEVAGLRKEKTKLIEEVDRLTLAQSNTPQWAAPEAAPLFVPDEPTGISIVASAVHPPVTSRVDVTDLLGKQGADSQKSFTDWLRENIEDTHLPRSSGRQIEI